MKALFYLSFLFFGLIPAQGQNRTELIDRALKNLEKNISSDPNFFSAIKKAEQESKTIGYSFGRNYSMLLCAKKLNELELLDSATFLLDNVLVNHKTKDSILWKSFFEKGTVLFKKGSLDSALYFFEEAQRLHSLLNENKDLLPAINNIAIIYAENGNFKKSSEFFFKALEDYKKKNISTGIIRSYNNLALVFSEMKDYASTEKYLEKALDEALQIKDTGLVFRALLNLGRTMVEQKKFYEGLKYYDKAYPYSEGKNRRIDRSLLLTNHGVIFLELDKLDEAEKLLNDALEINQQLSINKGKLNIYLNLGSIAFEKKNIKKAIEHLKTAEGFLSDNFNISSAIKIKLLLAKCYALSNNSELSIHYFENYVTLKDSASKVEQARYVKELETKHRVKEVQQEKNWVEAKVVQEKEKNLFYITIFSIALVALILFITLFYLYNKKKIAENEAVAQKQKMEAVIRAEEKERSRIAKDLHDGVAQDLAVLKHKILTTEKKIPNPELKTELEFILGELDKTTKEIREISYQMMPVALQQYGLSVALKDLLNRVLSPKNISFDFNNNGINERLPEKIETSVYRICQELLNNTVKHSSANHVSLLISKNEQFIRINYEDNGKGFDLNSVSRGIGLNSISSRIEMVKGLLEIDSKINSGTTAYIRIPL